MIDLKILQEETEAEIVLIAQQNGTVIDSINTKHAENIALMTESVMTMCNDLLKDITQKDLKQLIARSNDYYIVINKLESNLMVLAVLTNPLKFGLVIKHMNSL